MRKRITTVLFACALLLSLGMGSAEYDPSKDIRIEVTTAPTTRLARTLGVGRLGAQAFDLQEGAHATLTDTTGVSVDHYYVWVCFGSECVPVDPFTVGN